MLVNTIEKVCQVNAGGRKTVDYCDLPRKAIQKGICEVETMRVLIADDHAALRHSLTQVLRCDPDMEVVGEASDGTSAVQLARELRPDLVLMDIVMPRLNGIEATRQIVQDCPRVRVLGLSIHASKGYATQMLRVGARGYVLKDADTDELLHAVHAVSDGETYLSAEVAGCRA